MSNMSSRRRCSVCIVAVLLGAALVLQGAHAAADKSSGRIDTDAAKAFIGGKAAVSQCAKDCIAKARQLGLQTVAADSMACFVPVKGGQRMSTADCCDKAELLLGRHGSLANCMCCPEFAKELLQAVPLDKVGATHGEYLEKLNICRVPLVGTAGCSARAAKERAPLQPGSNGPPFKSLDWGVPLVQQLNLTGVLPMAGYDYKYTTTVLAAQGREAVAAGQVSLSQGVGFSDFYNEYTTGFMLLIEKETPRYAAPAKPALPLLPEQFKDDLAWVANLRRGPYPDLVRNRPQQFTPKATDVLQNGQIADMSPGVVFAGRVESLNRP